MSDKYQWFNGIKFTRDDKTGYYLNSTIRERIHRYIWRFFYGEIPAGYHVHHKDKNKNNNDITNFELKTHSNHISEHGNENNAIYHNEMVERMANAREYASLWHGSKEGIEWHKQHYENVKGLLYVKQDYSCKCCGKKFTANKAGQNKFCSNNCKSKWRRDNGLDNELRVCKFCNKEFLVNKFKKTECCSKSCSNRLNPRLPQLRKS